MSTATRDGLSLEGRLTGAERAGLNELVPSDLDPERLITRLERDLGRAVEWRWLND